MPNALSNELLAQIFAQESEDPFLSLVSLSHPSFSGGEICLVNNTKDIVSRGRTFRAFPMKICFPMDDGDTMRTFRIDFDNASLELIEEIRSVTTQIGVRLEMVLASMPDAVQIEQADLKISGIQYTSTKITATIVLNGFLNSEMTSEQYGPGNFPGIF